MSKNVNEVAVKGRQTKLAKKTYEELIQIILRKDKTERLNASTIKNLKAEINDLRLSNERLSKNVKEEALQVIKEKKDSAKLTSQIEDKDKEINSLYEYIKATTTKYNTYKGLCLFLSAALIISVVANILF